MLLHAVLSPLSWFYLDLWLWSSHVASLCNLPTVRNFWCGTWFNIGCYSCVMEISVSGFVIFPFKITLAWQIQDGILLLSVLTRPVLPAGSQCVHISRTSKSEITFIKCFTCFSTSFCLQCSVNGSQTLFAFVHPVHVTLEFEHNTLTFRIVFWDILPCKMIIDWRFRGAYCLHHQRWRQFWTSYPLPWELEISHNTVTFRND
jgi:hypothetical protein